MRVESWARSEIGRVRKSNQDAVAVYPDLGLFILADGMGGHAAGEVASHMAVEAIYDNLRQPLGNTNPASLGTRMARLLGRSASRMDPQAALRTALEEANRVIVQAGAGRAATDSTDTNLVSGSSERTMGSTAVVLLIAPHDALASFAHVGDSRLYRSRAGALALLTADHTLPGDPYRDEAVIPTDLPHTNVLLQALGTQPDVEAAVGTTPIEAGDIFLLCSDGISGMVAASFIEASLRNVATLEAAGEALIGGALDAGGRDNASLILVRITGE